MFVVKGSSLISSHQYSVQHFYKVFFFIPILFPLLPLRFHFSLIFFSSILLYCISIPVLQETHAVLDCVFYVYVVSKWPIEYYRLKVAFYLASQNQMIINGYKKNM